MTGVYVPAAGDLLGIKAGSGIVGTVEGDHVTIDYEGNLYGAVGFERYVNRVAHAYDRHATSYPTVARMTVPASSLIVVGWYDPDERMVHVDNRGALASWLALAELSEDELRA